MNTFLCNAQLVQNSQNLLKELEKETNKIKSN